MAAVIVWIGISIVVLILFLVLVQVMILFAILLRGLWKHFVVKELDLLKRYGPGCWAVVTGASSGQGREWALKLARRGFNLVMIGSRRCDLVAQEIRCQSPSVRMIVIHKNFARSFDKGFFDDIEEVLSSVDLGICVNNVAHRKAHFPSHQQAEQDMKDIISCSTFVQARMCQIAIRQFLKRRPKRSAMICTTAQCSHPNFGLGLWLPNWISLPYTGCYEGSNAWRFYHANSLWREYGHLFDWLTITPGAVITPQTKGFLSNTWGAVDCSDFVSHALRLLGNVQGTHCVYWKHAASMFIVNFWPFCKDRILDQTGTDLARYSMTSRGNKYDD